MARRVSPSRGSRLVAAALTLVREMPHTMAALQDGTLTDWRAEVVTREVAVLTPEQRTLVDAELAETLGDRLAGSATRSCPVGCGPSCTAWTRRRY